jgi:hypothetical protein
VLLILADGTVIVTAGSLSLSLSLSLPCSSTIVVACLWELLEGGGGFVEELLSDVVWRRTQ